MEEGHSDVIIIGQGQRDGAKGILLDLLTETRSSHTIQPGGQDADASTRLSTGIKFVPKLSSGQKSTEPYVCSECQKNFTCYADWYYHRDSHNTNHKFRCQLCNSGFDTLENYKTHHEAHKREYRNMQKSNNL